VDRRYRREARAVLRVACGGFECFRPVIERDNVKKNIARAIPELSAIPN